MAKLVPDRPDKPAARPDFAARRKAIFKDGPVLSQADWEAMEDLMAQGTIEDRSGL